MAPLLFGSKSTFTVIEGGDSDAGILQGRERQNREEDMLSWVSGEAVAVTKPKSSTCDNSLLSGGVRQGGGGSTKRKEKKRRDRRRSRMASKLIQKEPEPVRYLVDYELPSGVDRPSWDTDEVRRMVGEIE